VSAVIAENIPLKHELTVLCRPRKRAPNLSTLERFLFGFGSLFPSGERI
jgi:hypothetical protein